MEEQDLDQGARPGRVAQRLRHPPIVRRVVALAVQPAAPQDPAPASADRADRAAVRLAAGPRRRRPRASRARSGRQSASTDPRWRGDGGWPLLVAVGPGDARAEVVRDDDRRAAANVKGEAGRAFGAPELGQTVRSRRVERARAPTAFSRSGSLGLTNEGGSVDDEAEARPVVKYQRAVALDVRDLQDDHVLQRVALGGLVQMDLAMVSQRIRSTGPQGGSKMSAAGWRGWCCRGDPEGGTVSVGKAADRATMGAGGRDGAGKHNPRTSIPAHVQQTPDGLDCSVRLVSERVTGRTAGAGGRPS